jgi:hypothetical protein
VADFPLGGGIMKFSVKVYTHDSGVFENEEEARYPDDVIDLYTKGAMHMQDGRLTWFPPSQIRRVVVQEKK